MIQKDFRGEVRVFVVREGLGYAPGVFRVGPCRFDVVFGVRGVICWESSDGEMNRGR